MRISNRLLRLKVQPIKNVLHFSPISPGPAAPRHFSSDIMTSVGYLSSKSVTGVTLSKLYEVGRCPVKRLNFASFLHSELPIRLSQRVMDLRSLIEAQSHPERWKYVTHVEEYLLEKLQLLLDVPHPSCQASDLVFTQTLKDILHDPQSVVDQLAMGMGAVSASEQDTWDAILDRFFIGRVGIKFLLQHHVESLGTQKPESSGIIGKINLNESVDKAVLSARKLCLHVLGEAPEVLVEGDESASFTYIPTHLNYMLTETLKNALEATVRQHTTHDLPPVRVTFAIGQEDVTIKICDRGGGLARRQVDDVFKFLVTSKKQNRRTSLSGYGVGLPITRIYARYFGGELTVSPMEGLGTTVQLYLGRLGNNCESLPEMVRQSPAGRDSTFLKQS